jgi:ADP-heptose:LPS heptosyltransferase
VAVFRALKLGDLLVSIPALRAIRGALPDAEIVLIGLPWAREFVARFAHLLDGFREFPGWPGLPECEPQLDRIPRFLADMQAERFDLLIQLHGSGLVVNEVCGRLGAERLAGFYPAGGHCPDPRLFLPWPDRGLELRRLLALTEFLGFPASGEHLEFPLGDADRHRAAGLTSSCPGWFVCIHPGASVPDRRWPADRFAAVADALAARGLRVVLTGTAAERDLTAAVSAGMTAPALDLAGKTDLGASAAVIASARLLVCNDTGVSHIAAAVGTPSVVISTDDNPTRWAPPDGTRHRVLSRPGGWPDVADVLVHAFGLLDSFAPTRTPRLHQEGTRCAPSAC